MKPTEIKENLHKYIDSADTEQLNYLSEAIHAYALQKKEKENTEYKFDPNDPTPMTIQEYYDLIARAEENIKNGDVYTSEEVDAIIDSWDAEDQ